MAQRDYEEQPEAPDLGAAMQLDTAETLVGPPGADPLDAGYVPPDRPYGLEEDGVTGESLDKRLEREQPEVEATDTERAGRLMVVDSGAAGETPDSLAVVDAGIDGGAASAEEAAVHRVEAGIEPVDDESPIGDPEVSAALAQDPAADRALADAERDAAGGVDDGPAGR